MPTEVVHKSRLKEQRGIVGPFVVINLIAGTDVGEVVEQGSLDKMIEAKTRIDKRQAEMRADIIARRRSLKIGAIQNEEVPF